MPFALENIENISEKGVTPILIDKKLRGGLAKNELLGQ